LVHLKGNGRIKVFSKVYKNGNVEYWATSLLNITTKQAAYMLLDA
jgi:hypothetical protein